MAQFEKQSRIPFPAETVFRWHERDGAFRRLKPPWETVELVEQTGGVQNGGIARIRVKMGPMWRAWDAEHCDYEEGRQFRDVQTRGPFAEWDHTHRMTPDGDDACVLTDSIRYRLPLGILGRLFGGRFTRKKLERMFAYRHQTTLDDLRSHHAASLKKEKPMRVLITGSSGLVGSNLIPLLTTGGHTVLRLVRSDAGNSDDRILWKPSEGKIDADGLENLDAVVHLAGANIGDKRWTAERKSLIRNSRVDGTRLLAETLAGLDSPPKVLVCASAIGYYGDRGDEELDEESAPGDGFLPDVCRDWEAAADPAREKGIRVVHTRFGVILTPEGGALAKMLLPFKLGAGGVIGGGKQYWSWVTIDDVIGAILHALTTDSVTGPVNVTSPNPATNREFTKTLGRVLKRPTIFPMPAIAARLALGEMANDLLLASARVLPKKLLATDYQFRQPELEAALRHVLGR